MNTRREGCGCDSRERAVPTPLNDPNIMSNTAVICIAQTRPQTERIIDRLIASGFAHSEISLLMPDTDSDRDIAHIVATKAPEGTAAGAATGGVAGGVIGLLAGIGAIVIPGLGALLVAGPIMAALSVAAVGAATGGAVGGLIGLGIPELEAKVYEGRLRTGSYLVSVHAENGDEIDRAKGIFTSENAGDICTTGEAPAPYESKAAELDSRLAQGAYAGSL